MPNVGFSLRIGSILNKSTLYMPNIFSKLPPLNEGLNLFFELKAFLYGMPITLMMPIVFVSNPPFRWIFRGFGILKVGVRLYHIRICFILVSKGM